VTGTVSKSVGDLVDNQMWDVPVAGYQTATGYDATTGRRVPGLADPAGVEESLHAAVTFPASSTRPGTRRIARSRISSGCFPDAGMTPPSR
jgi:hypothetical protein